MHIKETNSCFHMYRICITYS